MSLNKNKRIFRFDDICINSDLQHANNIAFQILEKHPGAEVLYCISPCVSDMSNSEDAITSQRIFPKIYNAYSDHRIFYKLDKIGIPEIPDCITPASHGLVHVDHRLLEFAAQEMSILVSCSLAKSKIFVPPFNKWDQNTESICREHDIELVKFEDGWLCCEYNEYNPEHNLWYLHHREFTTEQFKKWLK
jgi:hypothetical protein